MPRNLHLVAADEPQPSLEEQIESPPPSYDYEWQDRKRARERNYARVHIEADRRGFFAMPDFRKWRYR